MSNTHYNTNVTPHYNRCVHDSPTPLLHTLDAQLANCVDFFQGFGAQHSPGDPTPWFRSGLPLSLLNGVRRNSLPDIASIYPGISDGLHDVPWSWWVGPDSASTTTQQLETLGFEPDGLIPHMAMETSVDIDLRNPLLRIERIADEGLRDFVTMWAPASGVPAELIEPITEIESHRDGFGTSYVCLGAFLGDELVGSAVVLLAHGVAGIYVVSTRSDHRRQGIGHDITAAAVQLAHELDAPIACLQASPMGAPLYEAMGFRTLASYQRFTFPARA